MRIYVGLPLLGWLRRLGLPAPLGGFGDETLLDGACCHTNVLHCAVLIDDLHALQIWVKLPFNNGLYVATNAAFFLCLTAPGYAAAGHWLLPGDFTNT